MWFISHGSSECVIKILSQRFERNSGMFSSSLLSSAYIIPSRQIIFNINYYQFLGLNYDFFSILRKSLPFELLLLRYIKKQTLPSAFSVLFELAVCALFILSVLNWCNSNVLLKEWEEIGFTVKAAHFGNVPY